MLVSNHLSWADSFVFLGESGARFVADSAYRRVPVLRTVLAAAGVLFIDRKSLREIRDVGAEVRRGLLAGDTLMVFPEADTSRGADVNRFRPGLLEPAAAARLPVGWAALRYETPDGWPTASRVVAWADWTPLILHMYRAFHLPRIIAEIAYGAEPIADSSRKLLAMRLETAVRSAYRPL
jgi:1-acyl-sn-glycerol-3-phosphate acyltransferase